MGFTSLPTQEPTKEVRAEHTFSGFIPTNKQTNKHSFHPGHYTISYKSNKSNINQFEYTARSREDQIL